MVNRGTPYQNAQFHATFHEWGIRYRDGKVGRLGPGPEHPPGFNGEFSGGSDDNNNDDPFGEITDKINSLMNLTNRVLTLTKKAIEAAPTIIIGASILQAIKITDTVVDGFNED